MEVNIYWEFWTLHSTWVIWTSNLQKICKGQAKLGIGQTSLSDFSVLPLSAVGRVQRWSRVFKKSQVRFKRDPAKWRCGLGRAQPKMKMWSREGPSRMKMWSRPGRGVVPHRLQGGTRPGYSEMQRCISKPATGWPSVTKSKQSADNLELWMNQEVCRALLHGDHLSFLPFLLMTPHRHDTQQIKPASLQRMLRVFGEFYSWRTGDVHRRIWWEGLNLALITRHHLTYTPPGKSLVGSWHDER
jgi:hypothetical protein